MGNVHNAYRRINNWLLDRHPDDFKSLPFPGVQTYFLYWNQTEREEWNAKRPDIGRPPKLADGWYLLFKCRDAYAEDELVGVDSIDSSEQIEARRFKDFLLSDLQVIAPSANPEEREHALQWVSLCDYSGASFVWFKGGGWRHSEVVYHIGEEAAQAYIDQLRAERLQRERRAEAAARHDHWQTQASISHPELAHPSPP